MFLRYQKHKSALIILLALLAIAYFGIGVMQPVDRWATVEFHTNNSNDKGSNIIYCPSDEKSIDLCIMGELQNDNNNSNNPHAYSNITCQVSCYIYLFINAKNLFL